MWIEGNEVILGKEKDGKKRREKNVAFHRTWKASLVSICFSIFFQSFPYLLHVNGFIDGKAKRRKRNKKGILYDSFQKSLVFFVGPSEAFHFQKSPFVDVSSLMKRREVRTGCTEGVAKNTFLFCARNRSDNRCSNPDTVDLLSSFLSLFFGFSPQSRAFSPLLLFKSALLLFKRKRKNDG